MKLISPNYDLKLDRNRYRQVENIVQQINALIVAEDRPATSYLQIKAGLLEATVHLQRVAAMYRVIIEAQESKGESSDGNEGQSA